MFSAYFAGFLRVRTVRKILDVFVVFLGAFEKNKEKKARVSPNPAESHDTMPLSFEHKGPDNKPWPRGSKALNRNRFWGLHLVPAP